MARRSADSDRLTPITDMDSLYQLRDLYLKDWPANCVGYYCLDNFIRWFERQREIKNLTILTLNNDWRSEGLYLVVDRYQLFVNSLNINTDKKTDERLLRAMSLLDWSRGYKISSLLEGHRSTVMSILKTKNLKLEYDSHTLLYYMPHKEALRLSVECPNGYDIRTLSSEDAEVIDEYWPNNHQGSLFLIQRLVNWNINIGVYDTENGELVAWCLRLQGGFLGALQVKDSHQRRNFGSLATKAISLRIAELGHDVMALVNKENRASRAMFDKVGFKVTGSCYWIRTQPTVENSNWVDDE